MSNAVEIPTRRLFTISLRALLLLTLLVSGPIALVAVKIRTLQRQQGATTAIRNVGFAHFIFYEPPAIEQWWRQMLFNGYCPKEVRRVYLEGTRFKDTNLESLKEFSRLEYLSLCRTMFTDNGLKHLDGLDNLISLDLEGTQITGEGLEHLSHLKKLKVLLLPGTPINEAGIRNVARMKCLSSSKFGLWIEYCARC